MRTVYDWVKWQPRHLPMERHYNNKTPPVTVPQQITTRVIYWSTNYSTLKEKKKSGAVRRSYYRQLAIVRTLAGWYRLQIQGST